MEMGHVKTIPILIVKESLEICLVQASYLASFAAFNNRTSFQDAYFSGHYY